MFELIFLPVSVLVLVLAANVLKRIFIFISDGECGSGLTWALRYDGTLMIEGSGDMDDYAHAPNTPWSKDSGIIKSVKIPNEVTRISGRAFSGCAVLKKVKLSHAITVIEPETFAGCEKLKGIDIPDWVGEIGEKAFSGCTALKKVSLPDRLESIGENAFWSCTNLMDLYLPADVETIGKYAFAGCSSLTRFDVSAANKYYSSQDGILFNKDKTEITAYPPGRDDAYAIPDSVTSIGDTAFAFCGKLKSVTIPDSVTVIGNGAFMGCGLQSITIPDSVASIGTAAFDECGSLTEIRIPKRLAVFFDETFTDRIKITDDTTDRRKTALS